jgi:glutamyl-tRNA synthetase
MGYLPEAMRNYLLRLGWAHGDDEVISTEQAIEWFGLENVGRSPARFDFDKLAHINGIYIRQAEDARLVEATLPRLAAIVGGELPSSIGDRLRALMPALKERAKTLQELAQSAVFLAVPRPLPPDAAAAKLLQEAGAELISSIRDALAGVGVWTAAETEAAIRTLVEAKGLKLGKVAQPLRAALTGRTVSPPIFDVLAALGKDESLGRLDDAAK